MTWVKICGTTNLEDALLAVDAGADALGFVFDDKSPRRVEVESVREIVRQLPQGVEKVGIFVDHRPEQIRQIVQRAGLTAVQLHRIEARPAGFWPASQAAFKERLGVPKLMVAISGERLTESGFFLGDEARKQLYAVLIDSGTAAQPGGTGKQFDWSEETRGMIQVISLSVPVIVAGGLNPENVGQALELFQPFGIDVVSGVEARPGKKDPEKVRAFVQAVRRAEKSA
ncbi:MAG TPA: phosphoribosylanthranilate isomerase [Terriglobales bacterium]|jgi:phosphoribosylanthranilate isomerase|nr:phosphoribosylanthranilate isomerase [Terriglobales bacterium]